MKHIILIALTILGASVGISQKNTLSFQEGGVSPQANLVDVAWIAGQWRGEALGGIVEEIWSPPLGNSMMGMFRMIEGEKVNFYELMTISEQNNTLILQLKHFASDLKGWEEKDETIDFRLVKVTKNKVYFDELTMERISKDEINMYVVFGTSVEEMKFKYKRAESN